MTNVGKWALGLGALAFAATVAWSYGAVYDAGVDAGKQKCENTQGKSNAKQQVKANKKTTADLKRGEATGNANEQSRAEIETFFSNLAKESANEAADPFDSCVLPDARVRRWNAASAGRFDTADQGRTAGQPHAGASAAAATGARPEQGQGLGGQPPAGVQGLPLAGNALLQPAGLSGDQP
ncbi:MAG: hypothetical protein V4451_05765 [Pseudomonadota bacterium]